MVLYKEPLPPMKLRFVGPVKPAARLARPVDGPLWAATDVASSEEHDRIGAGLVGSSAPLTDVGRAVRRFANRDSAVLITGEGGTGKEMVARAIHQLDRRTGGPFVVATRAAVPAHLLEAELFGREEVTTRGVERWRGRFELAAGGTLFLDEVGGLKAPLQDKLLRVLSERVFRPVGAKSLFPADVRVIVATTWDLRAEVDSGRFLGDLYSRLADHVIELPPLRERGDDVLLLARHFVSQYACEHGRPIPRLGREALELLYEHSWPGNIRELRTAMERAVLLAEGGTILPSHLIPELGLRD